MKFRQTLAACIGFGLINLSMADTTEQQWMTHVELTKQGRTLR